MTSPEFRFAIAVFLNGDAPAGASQLEASGKALDRFPPSGEIIVDEGTAIEERIAYTLRTGATFDLAAPLAFAHEVRAAVSLAGTPGEGFA